MNTLPLDVRKEIARLDYPTLIALGRTNRFYRNIREDPETIKYLLQHTPFVTIENLPLDVVTDIINEAFRDVERFGFETGHKDDSEFISKNPSYYQLLSENEPAGVIIWGQSRFGALVGYYRTCPHVVQNDFQSNIGYAKEYIYSLFDYLLHVMDDYNGGEDWGQYFKLMPRLLVVNEDREILVNENQQCFPW